MTPSHVVKVLDHLFKSLIASSNQTDPASVSESLGRIAVAYPSEWIAATCTTLSALQPSINQREWVHVLSHLAHCRPFPSSASVEPILDHCVTSLHSIEPAVRQAGLIGLCAIATTHSETVLSKLSFSLKIYAVSSEIFQLVNSLLLQADGDGLIQLMRLLLTLLGEEGVVKPELLGAAAACVATGAFRAAGAPTEDPIGVLRSARLPLVTDPHLLEPLMQLYDVLCPLCWRKDLLSSPSLYDILMAVAALVAVLPENTCSFSTLHSIQSAVLRLAVHAKSSHQLVAALETIRILTLAGLLVHTEETANAIIPIMIDIGISIGPLSLLRHPGLHAGAVQTALQHVWRDMSDRGIEFLVDRLLTSTSLSPVDRLVSVYYLHQALIRLGVASPPDHGFAGMDSLVACIEALCKKGDKTPHLAYAVLGLIQAAAAIDNFLLTVPVIDYVIRFASLTNSEATDDPSVLKNYWFSGSGGPETASIGPSLADTRTLAREVLTGLPSMINSDSLLALSDRLLAVLATLPTAGLPVLVSAFVASSNGRAPGPQPDILAWTIITGALVKELVPLLHPALAGGITAPDFPSILTRISSSVFTESVFHFLISKKIFERINQTDGSSSVSSALLLATSVVPLLLPGVAEEGLLTCLQQCDQELLAAGPTEVVPAFGQLMGSLAETRFPEYQRLLTRATALVTKARNPLVVLLGIKKSSTDLVFAIIRSSTGYSSSLAKSSELLPVVKSAYLEPCLETLRDLSKPGTNRTAPSTLPVLATLEAVSRICDAVKRFDAKSSTDSLPDAFLNELVSVILPLVLYEGDAAPGKSVPAVCSLAVRAVTSLAKIIKSISTDNFEKSIQFGVSLLVYGIVSFSTLDTVEYADRIRDISELLIAVLGHSFNVWLGISRLAQLLQLAGCSSPLPVLRLVAAEVYLNTLTGLLTSAKPAHDVQWLESVAIVIPRLVDPVTTSLASRTLTILTRARDPSLVANVDKLDQLFINPATLPDSALVVFAQLLLHVSTDAHHASGVYVLQLLNSMLLARGSSISQSESSSLVSQMFALSETQVSLQPEILECVHTLSSLHLTSSLREIIDEVVHGSPGTVPMFSESQRNAVTAMAREKTMLMGFIGFMSDLINNAEPNEKGLAPEAVAAAKGLEIVLAVQDTLVAAMVRKFAAETFGTVLLFSANRDATLLTRLVLTNLSAPVTSPVGIPAMLSAFADAVDESQLVALGRFVLPFLSRNELGTVVENQQRVARDTLCWLIGNTSKVTDVKVVDEVRIALERVKSVQGLGPLFTSRRDIFGLNEINLAISHLVEGSDDATIVQCLNVLVMTADAVAKVDGDPEWKSRLLGLGPVLTSVITDRQSPDPLIFDGVLRLVSSLCEVYAFTSDTSARAIFATAISATLMTEIGIRSHVPSSSELVGKTLAKLERIAPKTYSHSDFQTILSKYLDSRSPTSADPAVVDGAARLAVEIANQSTTYPGDRNRMIRSLIRFVRIRKRTVLIDKSIDGIIDALADVQSH